MQAVKDLHGFRLICHQVQIESGSGIPTYDSTSANPDLETSNRAGASTVWPLGGATQPFLRAASREN